jgi:hypothetical protein
MKSCFGIILSSATQMEVEAAVEENAQLAGQGHPANSPSTQLLGAILLILVSVRRLSEREVRQIACTCHTLCDAAHCEELWQVLLYAAHPFTAQLPAPFFDRAAGIGYRWYFRHLANRKIPDDDMLERNDIPPPVLRPSDLILVVEVELDGVKHASHSVQGEALEEFLASGRCTVPVRLPWSAEIKMDLDMGQLEFDGDELAPLGYRRQPRDPKTGTILDQIPEASSDWKVNAHFLRLSDFMISCLCDEDANVAEDEAIMKVEGEGWSHKPSHIEASRPFDRDKDLFEGLKIEHECYLPLDRNRLNGNVSRLLEEEQDFKCLECHVSPIFSLPHSPQYYVYDRMLERMALSAGTRLTRDCWLRTWHRKLPEEAREHALLQAEQQQSWRSLGAGPRQSSIRSICATANLVEVEVVLWVATHDGASPWAPDIKGVQQLLHLIDAMLWQGPGAQKPA